MGERGNALELCDRGDSIPAGTSLGFTAFFCVRDAVRLGTVGAVAAAVFARFGFFWTGSESIAVLDVSGSSLAWSDGIRMAELFLLPVLCDCMMGRLAGEGSLLGLGGTGKGRSSIRSFMGLRMIVCLTGELGRVCC